MNEREIDAGLAATPGYRYAEVVGDQLLVAGQVPLDAGGRVVGKNDPATQATACLDNLGTVLDVHGFTAGDVRRLTIHVVGDHQNLVDAWAAVTDWFDGAVPPATLLGAHLLGHHHQLVEVDATVMRRTR
jgi:enamine deaminase RidA (YjgF/YER057c/UK114 family)